jgi:rhodanese-related sulfurtransferase
VSQARGLILGGLVLLLLAQPAAAGHGRDDTVLTLKPPYARRLLEEGRGPVFVDLRPPEEFKKGRVPGARSLPLAELRRRHAEVPRAGLVILYCDCAPSDAQAAYQFLREQGYRNITLMEEGFLGWATRGFPVER